MAVMSPFNSAAASRGDVAIAMQLFQLTAPPSPPPPTSSPPPPPPPPSPSLPPILPHHHYFHPYQKKMKRGKGCSRITPVHKSCSILKQMEFRMKIFNIPSDSSSGGNSESKYSIVSDGGEPASNVAFRKARRDGIWSNLMCPFLLFAIM